MAEEDSKTVDDKRWEQLNRCPECGADMVRDAPVGERLTLSYRCREHGTYVYSWDHDRLERPTD